MLDFSPFPTQCSRVIIVLSSLLSSILRLGSVNDMGQNIFIFNSSKSPIPLFFLEIFL